METLADPVFPPVHAMLMVLLMEAVKTGGWVIVTGILSVHPLVSVTRTP